MNIHRPPEEVVFATGCAMLIDPAVIRAVGSFDSRLFAYCEDLDLSLRARKAGFKILVVPASVVYHAVAHGDQRLWPRIYYSTRNLLEVMRKHAAWYHWVSFVPNFLVRWQGKQGHKLSLQPSKSSVTASSWMGVEAGGRSRCV